MSAQSFEITLARLYTDPHFRGRFLSNPNDTLNKCDLTDSERADLMAIDKSGLILAACSFLHKRKNRSSARGLISIFRRICRLKEF